jgi:hypothetical protein
MRCALCSSKTCSNVSCSCFVNAWHIDALASNRRAHLTLSENDTLPSWSSGIFISHQWHAHLESILGYGQFRKSSLDQFCQSHPSRLTSTFLALSCAVNTDLIVSAVICSTATVFNTRISVFHMAATAVASMYTVEIPVRIPCALPISPEILCVRRKIAAGVHGFAIVDATAAS